jgi:type VI secretion system ImpH/TssG family protein
MAANLINDPIINEIEKKPWDFAFFQMLFIQEVLNKDKFNFGHGSSRKSEAALLDAYCNFSGPSSDFIAYYRNNSRLVINQPSLISMSSPLPQAYIERVLQQARENNDSMSDFLNIFNHRYFSFLYQAEKRHSIALNLEKSNHITRIVDAVAGMFDADLQWRDTFSSFARLLWQKDKTANGLISILSSVFPYIFKINEFERKKVRVAKGNVAKLDKSPLVNKIAGSFAFSIMNRIRIVIFIKNLHDYEQMFFGMKNIDFIKKIVKYYISVGIDVIYEVHLDAKQKDQKRMGNNCFLNRNAWLGSRHHCSYGAIIRDYIVQK